MSHQLSAHTHFHAEMMVLHVDRHTMRMKHVFQCVSNLMPDPFLDSEPFSKQPHQPGQLGDTDDILVGDIPDVGVTKERESGVLAQREEINWALNDLAEGTIGITPACRP